MKSLFLILTLFQNYPDSWWKPISPEEAYEWEILPQEANREKNEVILSKRTELGVFSNFAATPFILDQEDYGSIEGFWQMMKYPDPSDLQDPRNLWIKDYPYTRAQVMKMVAFEAKEAGEAANTINKARGINWISYKGKKFNHKDRAEGSDYHYQIIRMATEAKIHQNPAVKELLLKTGTLTLRPDHKTDPNDPPAYKYFSILMDIRNQLTR